jgi:hypothetical protein
MADTRAAMREFRFLDDKRKQGGLSATEEQRWTELRHTLGLPEVESPPAAAPAPDPGAYAQFSQQVPAGYYASDGNWYPYPAGYDPNAYAQQQAYYDPNAYAAQQQAYYDPNAYAQQQAYQDPNQQQVWDPAQIAEWARQQGYDPVAYLQWLQQQGYDPNAYAAGAAAATPEAQSAYADPSAYAGHLQQPQDPNAWYSAQEQQPAPYAESPLPEYPLAAPQGGDAQPHEPQQAYDPYGVQYTGEQAPAPEVLLDPTPELTAAAPDPLPVLTAEPDPLPVLTAEPDPLPVLTAEPDPLPVLTAEPDLLPVLTAAPDPIPELIAAPDPDPVPELSPTPDVFDPPMAVASPAAPPAELLVPEGMPALDTASVESPEQEPAAVASDDVMEVDASEVELMDGASPAETAPDLETSPPADDVPAAGQEPGWSGDGPLTVDPTSLGGEPSDMVPLAASSEMVAWEPEATAEDRSLALDESDQGSTITTGSMAEMAQDMGGYTPSPAEPVSEPMEVVSNAEFLQSQDPFPASSEELVPLPPVHSPEAEAAPPLLPPEPVTPIDTVPQRLEPELPSVEPATPVPMEPPDFGSPAEAGSAPAPAGPLEGEIETTPDMISAEPEIEASAEMISVEEPAGEAASTPALPPDWGAEELAPAPPPAAEPDPAWSEPATEVPLSAAEPGPAWSEPATEVPLSAAEPGPAWGEPATEAPAPATDPSSGWLGEPDPPQAVPVQGGADAFASPDAWANAEPDTVAPGDWAAGELPPVPEMSPPPAPAEPVPDLAAAAGPPVPPEWSAPAETSAPMNPWEEAPPPPVAEPAASAATDAVDVDLEIDAGPEPVPEPEAEIELTDEMEEAEEARLPPQPPSPPQPQARQAPPSTWSPPVGTDAATTLVLTQEQLSAHQKAAFGDGTAVLSTTFIEGEHRVIIHTMEGQVKRGTIRNLDLMDDAIPLELQAGSAPERIPMARVKAIFFMAQIGAKPPPPVGEKIRVTFRDGRQVAGYSSDYKGSEIGFFIVPADTRTNTARIYVFRSSVQAVAAG